LSQFVPSVSSRAKTDFIRCWVVALVGEERSDANCGGCTTRAEVGGGGCVGGCGVSVRGTTTVGGAGGFGETTRCVGEVDCGGLMGVVEVATGETLSGGGATGFASDGIDAGGGVVTIGVGIEVRTGSDETGVFSYGGSGGGAVPGCCGLLVGVTVCGLGQ